MGKTHKYDAKWYYDSSEDEWSCERCSEEFATQSDLFRHFDRADKHNYCRKHDLDFYRSPSSLESHLAASQDHHYCTICKEDLEDKEALEMHKLGKHGKCESCGEYFKNSKGVYEHARQKHGKLWYMCGEHKHSFASEASLKAHLASSAHAPRSFDCPANCGQTAVSLSAILLHLESGTCTSGLTRAKIDNYVQLIDPLHKITVPPPSQPHNPPHNPTQGWNSPEPALTYNSHSSQLYHPPPPSHPTPPSSFSSLLPLDTHLPSPPPSVQHRCPAPTCQRPFPTLSGLIQHIEAELSGGCGEWKEEEARRLVEAVVGVLVRLAV